MSDTRILDKLEQMSEKLSDIDKTLAVNTEQLKDHMRRSDALEALVQEYKSDTDIQLEEALAPIKTLKGIYTISKWVAAVAAAVSGASAILYALLKLHH